MIDYLVPDYFINISPSGSGGMHTKVSRVREAAGSVYQMHVGGDLSAMRSDFLLIEPLYFRMEGDFDLDALRAHPAKKILYCSEMEVIRWTGGFRKELIEICDVVTCNCDYQASLFTAVGIDDPVRLNDPIPEDTFVPLPKRMQVVAMGRISEIKASDFVAELFDKLKATPAETVYVGGAGLWGEADEEDMILEEKIRDVCDMFHRNIVPELVPKAIGAAAFFVGESIHDVYSSSHAEALLSGCIAITGMHPIYSERPGFSGKTVGGVIETIERLTQGFETLPPAELAEASREWAVDNLSYRCFTQQLTTLLGTLYD